MKRFEITYFFGPDDEYFTKEETVADMAASGITLAEVLKVEKRGYSGSGGERL